ncbi:glycoside hydrolase family 5 protein [Gordonia neofelifaecis]|uniref:Glycosidase n=1 Tax=Gordonia neofelifaecis NRRL B-59395 TaxID=644548 RepID=F1YMM4_9ACTN|nr:cellulase family glycosylhydrolase [Gordonia neofelifaecis]EGD53959.1 glycosidase [Gordonia neofelifaecis NRRL B-59395]
MNRELLMRRSTVATVALALVIGLGAALDPVGLITVVGWSGARIWPVEGVWQGAPFLLLLPIALVGTWWTVHVFDDGRRRFAPAFAGTLIALLIGKFVTALVSVGELRTAAWSVGYSVGKAAVAAVVVGAVVVAVCRRDRIGAPVEEAPYRVRPDWLGSGLFAVIAVPLAGLWWTGATYSSAMPAPNPARGWWAVVFGVGVLWAGTAAAGWWMRRGAAETRQSGSGRAGSDQAPQQRFLIGWYAAIGGGAVLGLCATVVGLFAGDGFGGAGAGSDLWPVLSGYIRIADGIAYGACLGWVAGLAALLPAPLRGHRADEAGAGVITAGESVLALIAVIAVGVVVPTAVHSAPHRSADGPPATATPVTAVDDHSLLPLRVRDGSIADTADREVLLRGVNVNQLVDFYAARPNVPATRPLTDADFAAISDLGFTVVRLNLSWSALEPERGRLDPQYLGRIRTSVDQAAAHGVYTVLDMHQDGWWNGAASPGTRCRPGTSPMWGFDGAPGWATITDGAPRCEFNGRDMSPAGDRAFNHFWYNSDGIRDALAHTWGLLAHEFADEPAVAGFDLLNEPGFGESAPLTSSLLLGRFYASAIREIRAAGADQIVFVEPSILWSGLAFDGGPSPDFTDDANIVFSPHLYAQSITMDASLGIGPLVSIERGFRLADRVAAEYGAPVWSGEYGYWGDTAEDMLQRFAREQDRRHQGGAYWVWKQACGDPQNGIGPIGDALMPQDCRTGGDAPPKSALLKILTRAYPQAAPGTITSLHADGADMELTGRAGPGTCRIRVWIPGTATPTIQSSGLSDQRLTAHGTGTLLTGCVRGDYRITTAG